MPSPPLWIALKFCIFARLKQFLEVKNDYNIVVNCSQILYLCTSETIANGIHKCSIKLWIALKFCIFARLKQWTRWELQRQAVVNCSQILYLCTSETIGPWDIILAAALWIALKFCIFARLKQFFRCWLADYLCCELLSNFVSLHVWNNSAIGAIFAALSCELLSNFVSLHVWNNTMCVKFTKSTCYNLFQK